jgi:hypothetical protein
MASSAWAIKGDYFETCNCDYLCPCIYTRMEAAPTHGDCKFSMVFAIRKGQFGSLPLDGLTFAVLGRAPGPMANGNWRVGLIIDEKASMEQAQAIETICAGRAGGPMAMAAPLVGDYAGSVRGKFSIAKKKMSFSIQVPDALDLRASAVESLSAPGRPIFLDNAGHPANKRLALARGTSSNVHAFGIDWEDAAGGHNAHFAPFNWASA